MDNAAAAIAAAHVVREQGLGNVTQESVVAGLQSTTLPGRIQVPSFCKLLFVKLCYVVLVLPEHVLSSIAKDNVVAGYTHGLVLFSVLSSSF